jgi:prophage regulatory protein
MVVGEAFRLIVTTNVNNLGVLSELLWTRIMSETFLRLPQIMEQTAMSRSEIYSQIQAGKFPKQYRRSHKITVWFKSEVDAWMQAEVRRIKGSA